jgi:hypothetical protein
MENRIAAQGQARLASSVHLVCRPRENVDGSIFHSVGEWRDVLGELPKRIHEWMPRLASEGVVGADAIFACLGPALEIFSRHSRVEKSNGEQATLREYLEHLWGAVANEALTLIFRDADALGLEADARLTALWFWVLKHASGSSDREINSLDAEFSSDHDTEERQAFKPSRGFAMEFDAARKLSQGLGIELADLAKNGGILEINGGTASLLRVSDRAHRLLANQLNLFGEPITAGHRPRSAATPRARMKAATERQAKLFNPEPMPEFDRQQRFLPGMAPKPDERSLLQRLVENGVTTLDRVHQAMLLFGLQRSTLLPEFLRASGAATNPRFWKLADNLNKLYPPGTEERRWVEGVLARKKGLGL